MTCVTSQTLYQGDTWQISVNLQIAAVAPSTTPTPFDLTPYTSVSAVLWSGPNKIAATASITGAPTNGVVLVTVPATSTLTIPADTVCPFPDQQWFANRVQVLTIDSTGANVTRAVIPIQVLAP